MFVWDGAHWWYKPYAASCARAVRDAVPDAPIDTLRSILDFCVHTMSPADAGALLVWQLAGNDISGPASFNPAVAPTPTPRLALRDVATHAAIRQLLTQVDGAAILDANGDLVSVGAHLRATPRSHELVRTDPAHGTRHASARRFSFDQDDTVIFVVSEDGPVTVYVDGAAVASIRSRPDEVEPSAGPATPARPRRRALTCPRCAKHLVAHPPDHAGDLKVSPATCPICGEPLPGVDPVVRVERPRRAQLRGSSKAAGRR